MNSTEFAAILKELPGIIWAATGAGALFFITKGGRFDNLVREIHKFKLPGGFEAEMRERQQIAKQEAVISLIETNNKPEDSLEFLHDLIEKGNTQKSASTLEDVSQKLDDAIGRVRKERLVYLYSAITNYQLQLLKLLALEPQTIPQLNKIYREFALRQVEEWEPVEFKELWLRNLERLGLVSQVQGVASVTALGIELLNFIREEGLSWTKK